MTSTPRHPALTEALRWLHWKHLPDHLAEISRPISELGHHLADQLAPNGAAPSPQLLLGIQRLVEAKDALVRAAVATAPEPAPAPPGIPAQS